MYHRAVRHLPDLQGPAAWDAILPSRAAYPTAPDNARYDVVIVGAGFAGLSAARRLTQIDPKLRIAVLDALAIGQGGTGRNSGFMIDLPHDLASEDYGGALTKTGARSQPIAPQLPSPARWPRNLNCPAKRLTLAASSMRLPAQRVIATIKTMPAI